MWIFAALMAHTVPEQPILWEDVRAGISIAEVRALRPAGERVRHADDRLVISGERVADDCSAQVSILHRSGSVEGVVLEGAPSIAGLCGDAMLASLRQRLGQPVSAERRRPFMRRARTTYTWRREGVTVRFVHYAAGSGAAALVDATNASWQMSVSAGSEPLTR